MNMNLSDREQSLVKAMEEFEIIDAHEHLGPEKGRVAMDVDVFTLFSHYTHGDLVVAGMSEADYSSLFNRDIALERRWAIFKPYWERIRYGSYARAALIAAEKFFGCDDINDATYQPLSEAIGEANTPGLYQRVLGDACNIRTALTQCGATDLGTELLTPVMPMNYPVEAWVDLVHPPYDGEASVRTLDDYVDTRRRYVARMKEEGAVGLKMMSNPNEPPNRSEALAAFNRLRDGKVDQLPQWNALRDYVLNETIELGTGQDLVICVHTGYWGDFRTLDPLHMIPLLERHQDTRFDIYHVGYPWVREALMLGKGFHNVWLNLCWTHIISQRFAMDALDEAIDLVPMNKILAFGGDYGTPVEKTYGHLVMAREDVARVMAPRIQRGQFSEDQALQIIKRWFWDNPKELYGLAL